MNLCFLFSRVVAHKLLKEMYNQVSGRQSNLSICKDFKSRIVSTQKIGLNESNVNVMNFTPVYIYKYFLFKIEGGQLFTSMSDLSMI